MSTDTSNDAVAVVYLDPADDVFSCPCCGLPMIDFGVFSGMIIDAEAWKERVNKVTAVLVGSFGVSPDYATAQAAAYVSLKMYKEWQKAKAAEVPPQQPVGQKQQSYIYFVQAKDGGPVKIGISADPERRIINLNHPGELHILATMPGDRALEAELHIRFAKHNIRREWFEPVPDLMNYIASIKAGAND